MSISARSKAAGYNDSYQEFDSPLMQQLRMEAYGQDIGQHSWVTAEELAQDIHWLNLSRTSRLLDLGCGPGGPLVHVVGLAGCHGVGLDSNVKALAVGRTRAAAAGLGEAITFNEADLNEPIPFTGGSFDAVMSLDVILHLPDRLSVFREVARLLVPGGRFLSTDAGILTGSVSNEEMQLRAVHGLNHFVPPGFNEQILERAGFRVLESADRTASLLKNASGRLAARLAHRKELEAVEGHSHFEREQQYLETVVALSERGAASRFMYLAELRAS